jgi:hypothetical protein
MENVMRGGKWLQALAPGGKLGFLEIAHWRGEMGRSATVSGRFEKPW